jgi:hypothetical protein
MSSSFFPAVSMSSIPFYVIQIISEIPPQVVLSHIFDQDFLHG